MASRLATTGRLRMPPDITPEGRPSRDLALYERLISDGIADADRRGSAIDHVTARRMAIWLLSRPQERDFRQSLLWFARSGTIARDLKKHLRNYARSPGHPYQPQAARLLQYAVARGTDLGPIGSDFAGICDQIDRADALLARHWEHSRDGRGFPETTSPDAESPQFIALARRDPASGTVSLVLDDATANAAIHAIADHAMDREAHTREVQRYSQNFPENSYGRRNRQAIADRETRIAERLRAIERAYRTALDYDAMPALDATEMTGFADREPDRELELE
jgi:hypothetical protein